ncbi:MAG: hypothetical protein CMH54_05620 [Myxococcales bacterium]|nr:hypothetical protein [Myxococcales bacterium]|tara:strand:- start:156 stop:935 length:780 start_codon:yes stop_codon:yes gene_type:complete
MQRIFVNGIEGAGIPADDTSVLLGLTVFETIRTYRGVPFRLDSHLERLTGSAEQMLIECPDKRTMHDEIIFCLEQVPADAPMRVRYTITADGNRIVDVAPLDMSRIWAPISVGRLDWQAPEWLPGVVKHGSRAGWIVAAQQQNAAEVLLVDSGGFILEANRSNVLVVKDGVVLTPPLDTRFLAGVTRSALLEAAAKAAIPYEERPLPFDATYDEFYLSSTLKELAPVVSICGCPAPGEGPIGRRLLDAFRDLVKEETGG